MSAVSAYYGDSRIELLTLWIVSFQRGKLDDLPNSVTFRLTQRALWRNPFI
jgi:hypothetical protein